MQLIEDKKLFDPQPEVAFNNIPGTFDNLRLAVFAQSDRPTNDVEILQVYFNTDMADSSYMRQRVRGDNNGACNAQRTLNPQIIPIPATQSDPRDFGLSVLDLPFYKESAHKVGVVTSACRRLADKTRVEVESLHWLNTAAVTRIQLVPVNGSNLLAGSRFMLYGF